MTFIIAEVGSTNKSHPLYQTWLGMRARCNNRNHHSYPYYGGRGIRVCDRWDNFRNFVIDMGPRPTGFSIDRVNNDGNYEPENCRWSDQKTQANNRKQYSNRSKRGPYKDTRSGCVGVYWNADTRSWRAAKKVNGKNIYLGLYPSVDTAKAAYDSYHK